MSRLIDADDVKELLLGLDSLPWEEQVDELVDAIPTAYNVDKVVEELEMNSQNSYASVYGGDYQIISVYDAIDTVKRGGIRI